MCEQNQKHEKVTKDDVIEFLLVMSIAMKLLAKSLMLQSAKEINREGGTPDGKM